MAKFTVWVKGTIEFEVPVEATDFNAAIEVANRSHLLLDRIKDILNNKKAALNDYEFKPYGVFIDDES